MEEKDDGFELSVVGDDQIDHIEVMLEVIIDAMALRAKLLAAKAVKEEGTR